MASHNGLVMMRQVGARGLLGCDRDRDDGAVNGARETSVASAEMIEREDVTVNDKMIRDQLGCSCRVCTRREPQNRGG